MLYCVRSATVARPGQVLAFEELEAGAAAGADVGHLVGQAALVDGAHAVAAADDAQALASRPPPGRRPWCRRRTASSRNSPSGRSRPPSWPCAISAANSFAVFGPMSSAIQPSGCSSRRRPCVVAPRRRTCRR